MTFKKKIFSFLGLFLTVFIASAQSKIKVTEPKDSIKINYLSMSPESLSDSIVNFGKIFLNTPYRYGSPGVNSFDCSGFTSFVYRNFGYNLQRSSCDQAQQFDSVDRNQLKIGDLVFFSGRGGSSRVGHVGIVVKPKENGQFEFIHAAVRSGVTISNSEEPYYSRRFVKANRVVGANPLMYLGSTFPKLQQDNAPIPFANNVQQSKKTIAAQYHRVRRGETLSSIAEAFNLTITELKDLNDIKTNSINRNQKLKVKEAENLMIVESAKSNAKTADEEEEESKEALSTTSTHVVKKGETLFSISKTYKVSVDELLAYNQLKNTAVQVGQQLIIAQITAPATSTNKTETAAKSFSYTVKKGESLFTISKENNLSIEDLKAENKLSSNNIQAGQEIRITPKTIVPLGTNKVDIAPKIISYMVKKGENLNTISKEYNVPVEDLKAMNKLTNRGVQSGQIMKIPILPAVSSVNPKNEIAPKTITHKVTKGESLFTISKEYNVKVEDIKTSNNLTNNNVQAGQELKITSSSVNATAKTEPKTITYKVKKGESLFTISKDLNVSIEEIKTSNKLSGNNVQAGQELKIRQGANDENKASTSTSKGKHKTSRHKVTKGESYFSIAEDNDCSVEELKSWNKRSKDQLNTGESLVLFPKLD